MQRVTLAELAEPTQPTQPTQPTRYPTGNAVLRQTPSIVSRRAQQQLVCTYARTRAHREAANQPDGYRVPLCRGTSASRVAVVWRG